MHDQILSRRLVGLDLGIATAHIAHVLDETMQVVAKRRVVPTVEGFTTLEAAALGGAPEGTRLAVVIEPTRPACTGARTIPRGRAARDCHGRCSSSLVAP